MDSIIAHGLKFQACHGLGPEEKSTPQTFQVDLDLQLDLQPAGTSDDLRDTIDYDQVYHLVKEVVTGSSFNLIETLAEKIASALLKTFSRLRELEVTVYKPPAPVDGEFDYFAVRIKRCQK